MIGRYEIAPARSSTQRQWAAAITPIPVGSGEDRCSSSVCWPSGIRCAPVSQHVIGETMPTVPLPRATQPGSSCGHRPKTLHDPLFSRHGPRVSLRLLARPLISGVAANCRVRRGAGPVAPGREWLVGFTFSPTWLACSLSPIGAWGARLSHDRCRASRTGAIASFGPIGSKSSVRMIRHTAVASCWLGLRSGSRLRAYFLRSLVRP